MELFYNENLCLNDESLNLGPDESRHLSKVLRKKVGEKIRVTNGHGLEWNGELIITDSREATAKKKEAVLHQNKIIPCILQLLRPKVMTVWSGFWKKLQK